VHSDAGYVHEVSPHKGGGGWMTRAARSPQWGTGKGRARISREGRGAGATARAGVCPVGEAVRCTRRVERVAALATVAHSLFLSSGSRSKRRANDTDQV